MSKSSSLLSSHIIEQHILFIRGQRVLLDADLAILYGVTPKRLNEQVRRNKKRFPADFMFQLTAAESDALRSQFASLKKGRGRHRKYLPFVFTEQGVAMLSGVLHSDRAIRVNIEIMRAFVRLKQISMSNREVLRTLNELENKVARHSVDIENVFEVLRQLMTVPEKPKRRIGFV